MKQPLEPNKDDCCNSGCNPCIFDVYEKKLRLYQKHIDNVTENEHTFTEENGISQLEYTLFTITNNIPICNSHRLIQFKKASDDAMNYNVQWKPGDHFLIKYATESIVCSRAYTPLKTVVNEKTNEKNCDFSILVKVYDNGLVSKYLSGLISGVSTLWRGPYGSYEYITNKYKRIIMIAQGTGIVAFIDLIEKILCDDEDMTRVTLYYCCKKQDILFRNELFLFKDYWNFLYKIFLSDGLAHNLKYQEPIIDMKLDFDEFLSLEPFTSNDQILICGSKKFMDVFEKLGIKNYTPSVCEIVKF